MRRKSSLVSQAVTEARAVASEGEAPPWLTLLDIGLSGLLLGASPSNYRYFGLGKTPWSVRGSLLTYRQNQRLMRSLKGSGSKDILLDKWGFAEAFSRYTGRDTRKLDQMTPGDLASRLKAGGRVVIKPRMDARGRRVRILDVTSEEVQNTILAEHERGELSGFLIEDVLHQHPDLTEAFGPPLHPLRVVTIKRGVDYFAWFAILFIGIDDPVVNAHRGALAAAVNLADGVVCSPALDPGRLIHSEHPQTGRQIAGTQLPFWSEVLELLGQAVLVSDGAAKYVGWDVGIGPSGPVLIEGNEDSGAYKVAQHPLLRTVALGGKGLKAYQGVPLPKASGS